MVGADTDKHTDPKGLQHELDHINNLPQLSAAVSNVDKIIELLTAARERVAGALDPHTASLTMTKLQNPVKVAFETVNVNLKDASQTNKATGKALDKFFPYKPLPADHDAMADHHPLINRAIAMHLLREGQFSVASTFIDDAQSASPYNIEGTPSDGQDEPMDEDDDDAGVEGEADAEASPPVTASSSSDSHDLSSFQSQELQAKFSEMYRVLQELKLRNLVPAIAWARANSAELEARGSNLEFELSKLQYVWLFKGPAVNGLPDDQQNGRAGAMAYARDNFGRFQSRHLPEIQQLASAVVFAPNITGSPYRSVFSTDGAFSEVASSFTREFCSLLGLSAESPLYIAATAGALALPWLIKYTTATKAKGTEWTTANELAFATPLPERMMYHSIFVCPVAKEQTTEDNPPMMIPCGHVLARETVTKLCKGNRFKCPYCPSEGQLKDARLIIL
ncbi:CTLH/CRA C-terminal to lish motif domain-containing protein [Lasiosphaeria miniovina]|uniref:GID complex catalytic subunit 2 n=1 Tax=Lasiosphaeria miniovina TaxID=1954250 RepID=A0AA40ECD7_9PEZI|nr:CTLH/CRA C-terminal to lish motif domain-containing protein [Lasiosphaeria miniovina]KAK0734825.1 CTLH/CRA C-terminal to lish motif domain-containing protein [Lasiosphaeria miniovina]